LVERRVLVSPYGRRGLMEDASASRVFPRRVTVVAMAVSVGVLIVIDSFSSGDLLLILGPAALYFVGGFLAFRNLLAGFVLLVVLFVMDARLVPFYERTTLPPGFFQGLFGLLNLAGFIAAIVVILRRMRRATYRERLTDKNG
jgi:hypothetical protein